MVLSYHEHDTICWRDEPEQISFYGDYTLSSAMARCWAQRIKVISVAAVKVGGYWKGLLEEEKEAYLSGSGGDRWL